MTGNKGRQGSKIQHGYHENFEIKTMGIIGNHKDFEKIAALVMPTGVAEMSEGTSYLRGKFVDKGLEQWFRTQRKYGPMTNTREVED